MIYGGLFDPDKLKQRINELEKEMQAPSFWDDKKRSESIIGEFNNLNNTLKATMELQDEIEFYSNELETDEAAKEYAEKDYQTIGERLDELEIKVLLNGKYDQNDAILEIHSGAGGTEACDWANMLCRMYTRWCEKHGFKLEQTFRQSGTEVGIKSISFIVKGKYAYGYLKNEKGVHRLVRISPFDANKRRHTSFASVEVVPVTNFDNEVVINDKDIRIDVFRSTGAGGQGVNTTDSAVRITHLPTKIVVTCQNERSQIQNKEKCMQLLKSKLYELQNEANMEQLKELKGEQKQIEFGSQIRSYVMCPYTLVKDSRTGTEEVNVGKVLDGDIDKFIKDNLKGA